MTKTILLIEDNPDDEALTLRALAKNNIMNRVDVARDGEEAIRYFEGRSEDDMPQVVLLDLKLPKIDGLEVLRHLRSKPATKHLPIVILTSSKEDRDLVEAYNGGANSYVQKPVDFVAFVDAVKSLGIYWLVLNQRPPGRGGR